MGCAWAPACTAWSLTDPNCNQLLGSVKVDPPGHDRQVLMKPKLEAVTTAVLNDKYSSTKLEMPASQTAPAGFLLEGPSGYCSAGTEQTLCQIKQTAVYA